MLDRIAIVLALPVRRRECWAALLLVHLVACTPEILDGHFACDTDAGRGCPDDMVCVAGLCTRNPPTDAGFTDAGGVGFSDGGSSDGGLRDASRSDAGATGPLLVFVTSVVVAGDLGGIPAADALCNTDAVDGGYPGTYVAWLSAPGDDIRDRLTGEGPWVTRGRAATIFTDRDHLFSTTPPTRAFELRDGTIVPASTFVWTGTNTDGSAASDTCVGWTLGSANGFGGFPNDPESSWTAQMPHNCGNPYNLVCFEIR